VSTLHKGDGHLHYSDTSHRWIAPPDIEQSAWEASMRAHLGLHRTTLGGPATVEEVRDPRPLCVPKPRTPAPRIPVPSPKKTVTSRPVAAAGRR
jgi:hypothetical protein